jgi:hypothetical protein
MDRRGHKFLHDWHRRSVELGDGRTLSWVAMLDREPARVECFAVEGAPVHPSIGGRLLDAAGHPDARLGRPSETTFGLTGPARKNESES